MNQPAPAPAAKKPNHPPVPNFDTMATMKALEKTGFDPLQAEGLVEFVRESQSRLATKEDLEKHRAATKADFKKFKVEMRAEFGQFRSDVRGDMKTLEASLRGEMKTLKADLRGDMKDMESKLIDKMGSYFIRMYGFMVLTLGAFIAAAKWL